LSSKQHARREIADEVRAALAAAQTRTRKPCGHKKAGRAGTPACTIDYLTANHYEHIKRMLEYTLAKRSTQAFFAVR
jgi:uncharacterized protein (DUF2342 family)